MRKIIIAISLLAIKTNATVTTVAGAVSPQNTLNDISGQSVAPATATITGTGTRCFSVNDPTLVVDCSNGAVMISSPTAPNGVDTRFGPAPSIQGAPIETKGSLDAFTRHNYTMIDPFDSVTSSFTKGSQGLLSKDSTDVIISTNSMKLSTSGTGLQTIMKKFLASPINLSNKQFIVWMKIDGIANLATGPLFYLSSNLLTSNTLTCDIGHGVSGQTYRYFQEGEWTAYTFTLANCTTSGSPDISAINAYQVAVYDEGVASSTVTIHVNGFASVPSPAQAYVVVEQDNADLTYLSSGAAISAQYGIPVQVNWTPENTGSNLFMSLTQATQTLQRYGIPFGLHPGGTYLDTVSTTSVNNLIANDQTYYRTQGMASRAGYCIYPHGAFNPAIQLAAKNQCAAARTIVNGDANGYEFETFPVGDPYRLRCYSVVNTDTLAKLQSMVTTAVTNKAVACFLFHRVVDPASSSSDVTPTLYRNFMVHLATAPVTLTTYPEILNRTYQIQQVHSISVSSAAYFGTYVSTQAAGAAGAAVTALCTAGTYATGGGGCNCSGAVAITGEISTPNCVTQGCLPTGWTCQEIGGTGGACSAYVTCSRGQ